MDWKIFTCLALLLLVQLCCSADSSERGSHGKGDSKDKEKNNKDKEVGKGSSGKDISNGKGSSEDKDKALRNGSHGKDRSNEKGSSKDKDKAFKGSHGKWGPDGKSSSKGSENDSGEDSPETWEWDHELNSEDSEQTPGEYPQGRWDWDYERGSEGSKNVSEEISQEEVSSKEEAETSAPQGSCDYGYDAETPAPQESYDYGYDETPAQHETPAQYESYEYGYDETPAQHESYEYGYDETPAQHDSYDYDYDETPAQHEPLTCRHNGVEYKINDTFRDPDNPCVSYTCNVTGLTAWAEKCPQTKCSKSRRTYDKYGCCYFCNNTCAPESVKINLEAKFIDSKSNVLKTCSRIAEVAICVGDCPTSPSFDEVSHKAMKPCSCCSPASYVNRTIALNCQGGRKYDYTYQVASSCVCNQCTSNEQKASSSNF